MKCALCLLALAMTPLLSAKDRVWQDATVLEMKSEQRGTYAALGANVPIVMTWVYFATDTTIYAVPCKIGRRHPCPDVTVNGHTKIAVEGRNLRILQDDGSETKFPIVSKIARPAASSLTSTTPAKPH